MPWSGGEMKGRDAHSDTGNMTRRAAGHTQPPDAERNGFAAMRRGESRIWQRSDGAPAAVHAHDLAGGIAAGRGGKVGAQAVHFAGLAVALHGAALEVRLMEEGRVDVSRGHFRREVARADAVDGDAVARPGVAERARGSAAREIRPAAEILIRSLSFRSTPKAPPVFRRGFRDCCPVSIPAHSSCSMREDNVQ